MVGEEQQANGHRKDQKTEQNSSKINHKINSVQGIIKISTKAL